MNNKITKLQLKSFLGLTTPTPWHDVYIEVVRSASGTVRAYTRGESLPFYAGGCSYDKVSTVLGQFLNYWTGSDITPAIGSGIARVTEDALKYGIKLQFISETKSGQIYHFKKIGA